MSTSLVIDSRRAYTMKIMEPAVRELFARMPDRATLTDENYDAESFR